MSGISHTESKIPEKAAGGREEYGNVVYKDFSTLSLGESEMEGTIPPQLKERRARKGGKVLFGN